MILAALLKYLKLSILLWLLFIKCQKSCIHFSVSSKFVNYFLQAGCEETADMIKENGGTAFAYTCDITDDDAVKQVAAETRRDLGDVDVVVGSPYKAT